MAILSNDRMVDVFPMVFDFKKGEQPSSAKLTKWVRLTDNAFHLITKAVGDPWDSKDHFGTITPTSSKSLSPQKLSQPTLARTIGPSEYIGPLGESINAGPSDPVEVHLNTAGLNSWSFGFPFAKTTNSVGPQMLASTSLQLLDSSDIVISGDAGLLEYFTTLYAAPRNMSAKGHYYIDYVNGIIQTAVPIDPSHATSTGELTVTISNLGYIGAGPPWGTHNVIPVWQDDYYTGVSIVEDTGPGDYIITLPEHHAGDISYGGALPRIGKPADVPSEKMTGSGYPIQDNIMGGGNQTEYLERPIAGTSYRLPYAIEETFESGDVFPDGVLMLWQNSPGRYLPLTEFEYISATEVKVTCPTLSDVSAIANTDNYRLVVTGTSLAEQISYLSAVVRDNPGQGLAYGSTASFPSVTYSPPISHDRLRDRFSLSGARESTWSFFTDAFEESWQTRFAFVESHVPSNPHPQYMHRAGWMSQDELGNSGNAMRGPFVFTSRLDPHTGAGTNVLALPGQMWDTWGLHFGGGPDDTFSRDRQNTSFSWIGSRWGKDNLWSGESYSEDLASLDMHLNFTNVLVGASPLNFQNWPPTVNVEYMYGALAYNPIWGTPLYVRGRTEGAYERSAKGGTIGFDLDGRSEMNYMKIMPADRALWNVLFNEINTPIPNSSSLSRQSPALPKLYTSPNVDHDWHTASSLGDIPEFGRWSSGQIREYRFRGVSENTLSMVGHQSIAAGEVIEDPSSKIIVIDDMPIVGAENATSIIAFTGNYLPHLFPGSEVELNGDGSVQAAGSYFVEWAFYVPDILASSLDITVAKLSAISGPGLVDQSVNDGTASCASSEMMSKFTSPGMLGADYFNVYGNALFFSDGGEGASTSFTDRGALWLDFGSTLDSYIGDQTPSGLFYHPQHADTSPDGAYYAFTLSEEDHDAPNMNGRQTRWPLVIGDNTGIVGNSKSVMFQCAEEVSTSPYAFSRLTMDKDGTVNLYSSITGTGNSSLTLDDNGADFYSLMGLGVRSNNAVTLASGSYPSGLVGSAIRNFAPLIGLFSNWNTTSPVAGGGISIIAGHEAEIFTGLSNNGEVRVGAKNQLRLSCNDDIDIEAAAGKINVKAFSDDVKVESSTGDVYSTAEVNTWITSTTGGINLQARTDDIVLDASRIFLKNTPPGSFAPISVNPNGQVFQLPSSRRYKTKIDNLNDISWLYDLSPVSFEYKNQLSTTCFGLIAEDVEKVVPELVVYNEQKEPESVRYNDLIAPLIKAVQDQQKQIQALETQLATLMPV